LLRATKRLIRLAEAIRSHPDEKDLFRTCANELHQVIPFDALSQFDPAANMVQWHFLEPYKNESVDHVVFLSTSAGSVLTGQARGNRVDDLASLQQLTYEHSDKMMARSFDRPATGGERNCKLVQLAKAVG
jgi:hypothetical protein